MVSHIAWTLCRAFFMAQDASLPEGIGWVIKCNRRAPGHHAVQCDASYYVFLCRCCSPSIRTVPIISTDFKKFLFIRRKQAKQIGQHTYTNPYMRCLPLPLLLALESYGSSHFYSISRSCGFFEENKKPKWAAHTYEVLHALPFVTVASSPRFIRY